MMLSMHLIAAAILSSAPLGVEIDCRSWPGGIRATVTMTLVAADGREFSGSVILSPTSEPLDVQIILLAVMDGQGWDVRKGPNLKVIILGPKGQGLKSVKFKSEVWTPAYKRILAVPPPKELKK